MTIPEAASLVVQAGAIGGEGEIFVLDMGEPVRILDLARNMIRLSGKEPDRDVPIEFVGARPGEKLHEELWGAGRGGPADHAPEDPARQAPRRRPGAAGAGARRRSSGSSRTARRSRSSSRLRALVSRGVVAGRADALGRGGITDLTHFRAPLARESPRRPSRPLTRVGRVDREAIFEGLNPEQRRAVEAVRGPVVILAGAGSGKTTTITRRIAWQVATGAFAAPRDPRRHLHRQGGGRDAGAAGAARGRRRPRADVPRQRAPAAALLRPRAGRGSAVEGVDAAPHRELAAAPVPLPAGGGPRDRDRVGQEPAHPGRAVRGASRATEPGRCRPT